MTRSRLHFSAAKEKTWPQVVGFPFNLADSPPTDWIGWVRIGWDGMQCEEGTRRSRTKCICLAVRVWLIFKQLQHSTQPLTAELLEQFKYIVITIITNTNGEQIRTLSVLIPHTLRSAKVLVIRRFWMDKYRRSLVTFLPHCCSCKGHTWRNVRFSLPLFKSEAASLIFLSKQGMLVFLIKQFWFK